MSKSLMVPAMRVEKALASNASTGVIPLWPSRTFFQRFCDRVAGRGNQAEAGDYDASLRHGRCLRLRRGIGKSALGGAAD